MRRRSTLNNPIISGPHEGRLRVRIASYHRLLLIAALLPGCAATRPAGEAAWQPLFNGSDLTGWVVKCPLADVGRGFWKVDNGTILADSMGCKDHDYVWLATEREYSDFVLGLKFQACRDSPGNSGVQVRSRYNDDAHWLDGPQVDINPPGPWRTGMIWDETRGGRRWLCPNVPQGKWVDPSLAAAGLRFFYSDEGAGWNDLEIIAKGMRLRVILNGVEVTNYDGRGVLNDAVHRQHNVGQRGIIALQVHKGNELRIRFKDIRIRELTR